MVAATHCFDRDLMDTLVVDNLDPISRAEASELIMATTLFKPEGGSAAVLVVADAEARLRRNCPQLMATASASATVAAEDAIAVPQATL